MRSCTPLTLADRMMRSRGSPSSSARRALSSADSTTALRMTCCAVSGSGRDEFSSMRRVSRSWSRLPQFTPMRTGLPQRQAVSIISANCGSRLLPRPTFPGLMRYLASASAHAGCSRRSLWPLKWKSPINGTVTPSCSSRSRIGATADAASLVLTVIRTSSEPARARALTCCAVPSTSAVSVFVMDCTTMGAPLPTWTEPLETWTDGRREIDIGAAGSPKPGGILQGRAAFARGGAPFRVRLGGPRRGWYHPRRPLYQSVRRESGLLTGTPKAQVPPGNAQAHERQTAECTVPCGLWRAVDVSFGSTHRRGAAPRGRLISQVARTEGRQVLKWCACRPFLLADSAG